MNESDTAGQDEAAVFISEVAPLRKIAGWFDAMWDDNKTEPIYDHDIARAKLAYSKAKAALEDAGIEANAQQNTAARGYPTSS